MKILENLPRQLYYVLKPWLSPSIRLAFRRARARQMLARSAHVWPINPAAKQTPDGWPGWPDGKQFAFVLTHDVEGPLGVGRVRALAELEMRLGFRSSFNFIPENDYRVPDELRHWLEKNGFEVGVHDLHHDGKLYSSRNGFRKKAARINEYLKAWNAAGFRSGFMHHNLEWMHDLNIEYDASTFDTDPFEPQPDGVNTIFPFWVERGSGSPDTSRRSVIACAELGPVSAHGYVELPYTLVQDFNLFVVLQERTNDIWRRKTKWVIDHGGMVMLDTHPDYFSFEPNAASKFEFSSTLYEDYLLHVRKEYAGHYWPALPREVASFVKSRNQSTPILLPHPARRILLGGALHYPDPRTQRYAETLRRRGDTVDVIALRKKNHPYSQEVNGVTVLGIQRRERNEKRQITYLIRLVSFTLKAFFVISWRHLRKPYDLVHLHSIPDFIIFAALVPKLLGVRLILDIYDVTPEFYLSKFKTTKKGFGYRGLLLVEKASASFANHVISANHLWNEKLASRATHRENLTPFVNYIDMELFRKRDRQRKNGCYLVVYPGVLNWHQGVDIAIRAFKAFSKEVPNAEFHIYGDGDEKMALRELIDELGLASRVFLKDPVPLDQIPGIMADADMGVVGKRSDVFGDEAYSTKIMEYMSQGIPTVIPRTSIDAFYFNDSVTMFYESGNHEQMAAQMLRVFRDPAMRNSLVSNGLSYVKGNSWASKEAEYLALVDRLIQDR